LTAGVRQIPHPEKAHKGGEDAYVLSDSFIAVADGVGGWNDVGVDPALFSKELCTNLWEEYSMRADLDLKSIFVQAVKKTKNKGSSTMVIASLDPYTQGVLKTLNLGDSGYILARGEESGEEYKLLYRSPE
jgi:protein phosphatase PTC7